MLLCKCLVADCPNQHYYDLDNWTKEDWQASLVQAIGQVERGELHPLTSEMQVEMFGDLAEHIEDVLDKMNATPEERARVYHQEMHDK